MRDEGCIEHLSSEISVHLIFFISFLDALGRQHYPEQHPPDHDIMGIPPSSLHQSLDEADAIAMDLDSPANGLCDHIASRCSLS